MTVKELVAKLQALDQDAMIVTRGYEGGVTESSNVAPVTVRLNVNTAWYYGEHEIEGGYMPEFAADYDTANAVVIG
jgi:hypothetical protein